ncbi:MAG: four helix bundle protein [Candidatus Edwardsbacteria bacterium]|nr:four helix bundle protein [Candidatus Edwardsbacteria bacterium]
MEKRDICERTFAFAVAVIAFCRSIERGRLTERLLAKQLFRSGTSIGANVEEAQAGQSRADFISKMSIARKEARETKYWFRLAKALGMGTAEVAESLLQEADEFIAIITVIIKRTKALS